MNGGSLDVTPLLRSVKPGEWSELRIRLRCFAEAGAEMTAIDIPMRLSASSGDSIAFNDVRLVPATEGETAPCPAPEAR
jgi:beta-glucosidase